MEATVKAENILKSNGLRKTHIRLEMLQIFMGSNHALSVNDLEKNLKASHDRVTIYRALNSFEENGIEIYYGRSGSAVIEDVNTLDTFNGVAEELVYRSIKHLYYSGFSGSTYVSHSFENYLHTSEHDNARVLTDNLTVISIPKSLYGTEIKPGSISLNGQFITASDNNGYIYQEGVTDKIGDVIYKHGLIILTNQDYYTAKPTSNFGTFRATVTGSGGFLSFESDNTWPTEIAVTGSFVFEEITYTIKLRVSDTTIEIDPNNLVLENPTQIEFTYDTTDYSNPLSVGFKNTYDILTHNYNCRISQNQLNFSQNPSSYTNTETSGSIINNITGSEFQPYITTVGLYNDANELVAVGKLGQPMPKSQTTDMTFKVRIDM